MPQKSRIIPGMGAIAPPAHAARSRRRRSPRRHRRALLPPRAPRRGGRTSRPHLRTHSGDGRWNVYPIRSVRTPGWKYILNLHPEFAFTTHIDLPGNLGQRSYFSTWEAAARSDTRAADLVKRYHARPAEELYDLAADPHEGRNLAADPQHAERLETMRDELQAWMIAQGDRRTVFAEPRLLADPSSFGPNAPPGNVPAKPVAKEKAHR